MGSSESGPSRFKQEKKTRKIHTLKYDRMMRGSGHPWVPVNLDHPATFDTLAMDLDMKKTIMEDLEMFVRRREFYRKVGKAWKRGYLLYGPPGTGKSSLIAAMANYLNFDIYDLELTDLSYNSDAVGEQLMKTEDSDAALKGLVEFLKVKKAENELKANCPDKEDDEGEIVEEAESGGQMGNNGLMMIHEM